MSAPDLARQLSEWISRNAGRIVITLGIAMVVAYVTAMSGFPRGDGRVVAGDATHHFVQLRSLVFDGDLHFQNDYVRIYGLKGGEPDTEWIFSELTGTGYVRNYMPIGPALLWAPLYLLTAGVQWLFALIGVASRPDGFDWPLQLSVGVTGIVAATAGVWLSWRTAALYTSATAAGSAVICVWIGTHALYYSLVSPAYSHAASILTSAVFFSNWLRTRADPTIGRAAVWGALAGAAALMRWQDGLFLLIPLIDIARWDRPWSARFLAWAAAGLAAAVVFLPQMAVWQVLYGRPLALPQGPSFMQWTSPELVRVLFSDRHGLFTWAPLLLLATAGLITFLRRRHLGLPVAIVLLTSWYINAAVADWWAGEAFGARRFLSLFPLFVLGLSAWLAPDARTAPRLPRLGVAWVLVGANLLLLLQYQLAMKGLESIAPYPNGWFDMWIARFLVPGRLLAWWAS
jgi:hypothetical protein